KLGDQNIAQSRTFGNAHVIPGTTMNFEQWSFARFFTAPWWLTMAGNDSVRGIGPVFLVFLPFFFFVRRWPTGVRVVFGVFIVSYLVWFIADPLVRYLTTISGLCIALAYCVWRL